MIVHYFSEAQANSDMPQFVVKHYSANNALPLIGNKELGKSVDVFEIGVINIPSTTDHDRVRYLERIQNGVANLLNDIFYGIAKNQERKPILNFNTDGFWTRKRLLRLLECRRNNSVPNDAKILDGFVRVETEQAGEQGWIFDKEAIQQQYSIAERLSEWQELYNITRAQIEKLMDKSRNKVSEKSDIPKTGTWMEQQEREVNALNKKQQEEFWWGPLTQRLVNKHDVRSICFLVFQGLPLHVFAQGPEEAVEEFKKKMDEHFRHKAASSSMPAVPRHLTHTKNGHMITVDDVLFPVDIYSMKVLPSVKFWGDPSRYRLQLEDSGKLWFSSQYEAERWIHRNKSIVSQAIKEQVDKLI